MSSEPKRRSAGGLINRSPSMKIAAYYLSRCGSRDSKGAASPPSKLHAESWKAAYDIFFEAMGDGRGRRQFRNSLKNARDVFDVLFDNGRIGWINTKGEQPDMSLSFQRVHEEWGRRSDSELERFVLQLLSGNPEPEVAQLAGAEARTEGGLKVFISSRQERDPALREDAIRIHGLNCMVCGFNFESFYGEWGRGFIEVHHVKPLSEVGVSSTDPQKDLAVVCANCHRMIHRKRGVCLTIDGLQTSIHAAAHARGRSASGGRGGDEK